MIIIATPDEILRLVGKQPEPEPALATFRGEIQLALDKLADEVAVKRGVSAARYKAAADGARAVEQEPARKPLATAKNPAASVKPIDWAALVNTLRLRC